MNKGSFFMLSSFLFVRHPFLGPVGSHPPGKRAGSPASLPVCLFPSMPVCRQAQGLADWQAGWQGCQPGSRQACRPFRLQRKGAFSKVVSFCRCVAAFGVVVAACGVLYPALSPLILRLACGRYLAFSPFRCLYASVPAGRHKGKQTGRQVNWQAGKNACHLARKNASL